MADPHTTDAAMQSRVGLLARVGLFSGFSRKELETLAPLFVEVCYGKGETICREGEPGETFFLILSGELEVWSGAPARMVGRLGPGEFVGEMTLLLGGVRTATVEVARRATLLALDKPSFDRFFGNNPKALEYLSRVLCRRLMTTSRNQVTARRVTTIGVGGAPGLKGKSLVAAAIAGLLRDFSAQDVLRVELSPRVGNRRRSGVPLLAQLARASTDGVSSRIVGDDPPALSAEVRASDPAGSVADQLTTLLGRLGERFAFIVLDLSDLPAPTAAAIAESCDFFIEVVARVEPTSASETGERRSRSFRVLNLFNDHSATIAINRCEPFVLPFDAALMELDPLARTRRLREDRWSPIARPLHRLARKLLGSSVGMALGGGAAFGLAHVGVFKVLEEHDVPIDLVAGTSMGSIVALAYAAGMRASEMVDIARRIGTKWTALSALDFTLSKPGLLAGNRLVKIMTPLFGSARGFEDLRVPCQTVATDIEAGARVTIDSGRLDAAFRASCSVPMLWSPVRRGDQVLVDGAVIDPVPAEVVHEMGADVCLAVNVVPPLKRGVTTVLSRLYQSFNRLNPLSYLGDSRDLPNMFDIIMNSLQTLQCELGNFKAISADVRINPDLSHLTWIEFYRPNELIECGALAAERALPDIKRALAKRLPIRSEAEENATPAPGQGAEPAITFGAAHGTSTASANGVRLDAP